MPWNLLLLPLIAGYYILTRSYLFKFKQQRLDRQRLIFESVLLGVAAAFISYLFRITYEWIFPFELKSNIYRSLPIKTPYIGTSICTLFLSILLTELGNLLLNEKKYIKTAIKNVGNELELIFQSSFSQNILLQFTLDNDKVYIAWVKELPIPSISNYVRVIPAISGYRDEQKILNFTTHYLQVYAEYIGEGKIKSLEDLPVDLVININEIVSVGLFDSDMYERFNKSS